MAKETVSFNSVSVIRKSDAALFCLIDGERVWIPFSQIDDDSEVYDEDTEGQLIVTEWIAIQKGLV
jgi:hypothetical protein